MNDLTATSPKGIAMTTYPDTHPYRYDVWFTVNGGPEQRKEMAFTAPRELADIQALNTTITITRVEVYGGTR